MTLPDWLQPFLTMDISFWEKVLRTVVVYLGILILVRVAGKRLLALGELGPSAHPVIEEALTDPTVAAVARRLLDLHVT